MTQGHLVGAGKPAVHRVGCCAAVHHLSDSPNKPKHSDAVAKWCVYQRGNLASQSIASIIFMSQLREEHDAINMRHPLNTQLINNASVTLTEIFVALVVHYRDSGICGTHSDCLFLAVSHVTHS